MAVTEYLAAIDAAGAQQMELAQAVGNALCVACCGLLCGGVAGWLLLCQLTRRSEDTDVVFGEESVWLPATGLRRRGRSVRYADIDKVAKLSYGRRVRVHWEGGRATFDRDFLPGGGLEDFLNELVRRARLEEDST